MTLPTANPLASIAGYALQRMTGSETLAYLSVDNRELVRKALETLASYVYRQAQDAIEHGIRGVFSWVGPEVLREKIRACVKLGAKSGRFILCPSAGYMEYPEPEEKYLSNLMLYLDEGLKAVTNA